MKFKGVIFNIDNVLYDTTFQKDSARINAIKAMIESGLPVDVENGFRVLREVITEYGTDYPKQFDKMLEKMGINKKAQVIAAGVNAYRETSRAYLQPYYDTIPVILSLRDLGCKVAVLSEGDPVKQWQKLIRLGTQHLFHKVLMSKEIDKENVDENTFKTLLVDLSLTPNETIFVGNMINDNFVTANRVGITSVWIRRGITATETPRSKDAEPHYQLETLNELIKIIKGESAI